MGRVGTKAKDRRWKAPDGTIWASKFEWHVFNTLTNAGVDVRRCKSPRDTIHYNQPRRCCTCLECGSHKIVQGRTYTPDICIRTQAGEHERYVYPVEVKGYFRASRRALFRAMVNSNKAYPLRVILERDLPVVRGKPARLTDYFKRCLKTVPVHVWDGDIPEDWK